MRTLIADDEVLARQKLRRLLLEEPDIEIIGEGSTAAEILDLVKITSAELIFLDIHMPGMDGFELINRLYDAKGAQIPNVIFTTAYDQYALRAFEIRALDYLLKPYTAERLHQAVERARNQLKLAQRTPSGDMNGEDGNQAYADRIVFKSRGRILFLPVSEIRWIGAEENYVRICTGTETHLLRETMAATEKRLDPSQFLRVHRSAIVNLRFVKEVRTEGKGDFVVHMLNGQRVSMSRSYHSRIGELLATA
ncbi:MAG TPA: LytTR family DNA-binding domain-containing protein [Terracidiphilus sp.]|nr:LytTR family DNA-binding domain-containing protein [Terracidiphilus sp.]